MWRDAVRRISAQPGNLTVESYSAICADYVTPTPGEMRPAVANISAHKIRFPAACRCYPEYRIFHQIFTRYLVFLICGIQTDEDAALYHKLKLVRELKEKGLPYKKILREEYGMII